MGLFGNVLDGSVGRLPQEPLDPLDHSIHGARRHDTRPCASPRFGPRKRDMCLVPALRVRPGATWTYDRLALVLEN